MFHVYILKLSNGKFYIGQTANLPSRIARHETGQSKYTRSFRPLKLMYAEQYASRSAAMAREKYLKSLKSRQAITELIATSNTASSSNG